MAEAQVQSSIEVPQLVDVSDLASASHYACSQIIFTYLLTLTVVSLL